MFKRGFSRTLLMLGLAAGGVVQAEEIGNWGFAGSGFLSVTAGTMLSGTRGSVLNQPCPCFVADFAQNAIYDGRGGVQLAPDSKLGLQGTATLPDPRFSITAQAVARGSHNGKFDVEWLYGTYQLSDNTSLQIGRKRLPLFYYSDSQDVGFTLPWTHLPPQLYGWEAVNYNGISVRHRDQLGAWDITANLLAGSEHTNDVGYWNIYNGQNSRTDVKWDNIYGGNITLAHDWFETRLAYLQSSTQRTTNAVWNNATQSYVSPTDPFLLGRVTQQKIYTATFNADLSDWVALSEFLYIDRPGASFKDYASRLGVIRRFNAWEMGVNVSEYHSQAVIAMGGDPQGQEKHINRSLTVRYFLTPHSDLKAQFDAQQDRGGINFSPKYGNARLLTLAYDRIF